MMKKSLLLVALITLLSCPAMAQQPKFTLTDGLLIGSAVGDEASSIGLREVGLVKNQAARIGVKVGAVAAIYWLEKKYPENRKVRVLKWVFVGAFAAGTVNNLIQRGR